MEERHLSHARHLSGTLSLSTTWSAAFGSSLSVAVTQFVALGEGSVGSPARLGSSISAISWGVVGVAFLLVVLLNVAAV